MFSKKSVKYSSIGFLFSLIGLSSIGSFAFADSDLKGNAEDSPCFITDGKVGNLGECLLIIKSFNESRIPFKIAEDTTLVGIEVIGNKMIQRYDVSYGGDADFNDDESFDALRNVYIKALPNTSNKTCNLDSTSGIFYKNGLINEYRYRVNGSEREVIITLDEKYCSDINWNK